ncbi:hypothetical protein LPJ66_000836 [Kickxella alabastrina]|uniref:Uncharacterized protein n=1 Tax=Kickxella alabastrina TaxID=61397 RepID=A0ACC1IVA1_9FUNG|nr:hypothetical protein LPJ66_000836 [Kickxella alabastrina]
MKFKLGFASALVLVSSLASMASAHTFLRTLTIDGKQTEVGQCIEPYHGPDKTSGVKDPASDDMTCGFPGSSKDADLCPVEPGSEVRAEFRNYDNEEEADGKFNMAIDESHQGPCFAYMAPLESGGKGDVWFKIFEDGYSSGSWCVNKIRFSMGFMNITIPEDILPGDYLLRTEVIGLQEAMYEYEEGQKKGAQYFINCAHITVSGSGTAVPQGYAIPGIYKQDEPSILFDLDKDDATKYVAPGPALYLVKC